MGVSVIGVYAATAHRPRAAGGRSARPSAALVLLALAVLYLAAGQLTGVARAASEPGLLQPLQAPGAAHAESMSSSVTMFSEPGDVAGGGVNRVFDASSAIGLDGEGNHAEVTIESGGERFYLEFVAPAGRQLEPGEYLGAQRPPWHAKNLPGLFVSRCDEDYGRFTIKDIGSNAEGRLDRLWLLYEVHCETPDAPLLFGEVRIGEPQLSPRPEVVPAAVTWPRVAVGTEGLGVPVTVVASHATAARIKSVGLQGEDAGDFKILADGCSGMTVPPGEHCEVIVADDPTATGLRSATLVIKASGHRLGTALSVNTEELSEPPPVGDSVTMVGEPGNYLGGGIDRLFDTEHAITISGNEHYLQVNVEGRGGQFSFEFAPPAGRSLEPGEYDYANSAHVRSLPVLTIGGNGVGCGGLGRFTIKDIGFDPSGNVDRFWALYEEHCGGYGEPAVFGEVRVGEPPSGAPELVQPAAVRWPRTAVGAEADTVPVTVGAGPSGARIASVALEGEDAGDFSIVGDGCSATKLAPGARCELGVSARPAAAGLRTAELVVSDTTGARMTVPLTIDTEPPPEPPAVANSATLVSEPGAYIGEETDLLFDEAEAVTVSGTGSHVEVQAEGRAGRFTFNFAPPAGHSLEAGEYDYAEGYPFQARSFPGIDVDGNGRSCSAEVGRFTVMDIGYDSAGNVDRFWALYEQRCAPGEPALFGEVRVGEPPATAPELVQPAAVQWPQTAVGTAATEVPVTVAGGASGARIHSVALEGEDAGDFSIVGDGCSGTTLAPAARCVVSVLARPSVAGTRTAELVLTDSSAARTTVPLRVETEAPPEPPMTGNSATVVSEPGEYIGRGVDELFDLPDAVVIAANRNQSDRVEVEADGRVGRFRFVFAPAWEKQLTVGEYKHVEINPWGSAKAAGLSVTGNATGCGSGYGRFTIKDIGYDSAGNVDRFWALYEQHCDGQTPALFGEVRVGEPPGAAPELVQPLAVRWPKTAVGDEGATVPVTVSAGAPGAAIAAVRIEGKEAADFSIASDECGGVRLPAYAHCEIKLGVRPTAAGTRRAKLAVVDSSGPVTKVELAVPGQ